MQTIDNGFCRTSSAPGHAGATQGFRGFHESFQDRADQLVRTTVLSDLGQSVGHGRHGHGIQAVAAAVGKALSGQDVTGTDAADDVLKKIETSLHEAAQKLADRGVDAKTIDATIDRFRSQLANALDGMSRGASGAPGDTTASGGSTGSSGSTPGTDAPSNSTPPPAATTTSVSKFVSHEVRKEHGAIDLVTAEGDRVSIRFRTKDVVNGSVKQATSSDGTATTATKASLFSRGGMKIDVDGDLNEDELDAIGDLLGKVDDIATQFFSGDVQAAFSAASDVGVDSDQIAAYRLNVTYSRKVVAAYRAWGSSAPVSTQSPAPAGNGTTPAPSTNGSTTATGSVTGGSASASTRASTGSTSTSTNGAASATDSPASESDSAAGNDGSAGAAASSAGSGTADDTTSGTPTTTASDMPSANTPPVSAKKTIIDFINDALSKLGSASGAGRLSFSTHWKMSVLVTAIQSTQPAQPATATDQAAATNTQLLGESLQKIAAA